MRENPEELESGAVFLPGLGEAAQNADVVLVQKSADKRESPPASGPVG
ncbi:hypothetical protein [Streptomyces sp. NPDC048338]